MRRFKSLTVVWVMSILLQTACFAQTEIPFSLSISTRTPTVKKGAEVRLEITVTNVSKESISVYAGQGEGDGHVEAANQIDVRDGSGNFLPRIDGQTRMKNGKPFTFPKKWFTRKGFQVGPGEQFDNYSNLSEMFDLTKPGNYSITAEQSIRHFDSDTASHWITATSNAISITVTE